MSAQSIGSDPRWAVLVRDPVEDFLAGRYCWSDASADEACTRTFPTRQACRDAIKAMRCFREHARPVRVRVVVEVLS